MRIVSPISSILGARFLRLDNGPVLIGVAAVAVVIQAAFVLSLLTPAESTTRSAADNKVGETPMRMVGAGTGSEASCREQTWPYFARKCVAQADEKRPSHGARGADLNAPPAPEVSTGATAAAAPPSRDVVVVASPSRDVVVAAPPSRDVVVAAPPPRDAAVAAPLSRDVVVAAPLPRDTFDARFWPAAVTPTTDAVKPRIIEAPREARPVREARKPAARETRNPREVRSEIVRGPDGRQWKRTTYTVPLASGGTKQFQVGRLVEQNRPSWGVFGRGF